MKSLSSEDGAAWLAVLLILVSVIFGGQSHGNLVPLAVVGVVGGPLLAWALWSTIDSGDWRAKGLALAFVALVFAAPLFQLVPVPPGVYAGAPGRGQAAAALALSGVRPGWMPLSMYPDATHRAALALMAPAAMLLMALGLRRPQQFALAGLYVLCGGASLLIGLGQLASRGVSLYVSHEAVTGSVLGLFANRNHLAAFLICLAPLAAALFAELRRRRGPAFPATLAMAGFSLVLLLALALIRSRFGLLAVAPVLAASACLLLSAQPKAERRRGAALGIAAAAALALAVVAGFGLSPLVSRFTDEGVGSRPSMWVRTLAAARPFAPLGAGPGSFDRVYRSVEPVSELGPAYLNQAHNDYVEGWLESGVLWVVTVLAGAALYLRWSWRAWRSPRPDAAVLPRAASVGLAVIAAHSVVDYPMRTEAMAVFAAFLLGVLGASARSGEGTDRR